MRDFIMKYGITCGQRYTPRQKKIFIQTMCQDLKDAGCQVSLAQHKGLFQGSTHLLIQQPEQAKKIIMAYYDTPSRYLIGNCNYTPFDPQYNTKRDTDNLLVQSSIALLLLILLLVILLKFSSFHSLYQVLAIALMCFLGLVIVLITKGFANRFNYNRNSAAVVLIRQLAEECKEYPEVGFILMDRGCDSYLGFQQLLAQYPQLKEKEVIILESLASGDTLVEATSESSDKIKLNYDKLNLEIQKKQFRQEKANQTALGFFNHCLWLVSGTIENRRFVVKNTRTSKDYHIDLPRLETIRVMLKQWAEKEEL